MKPPLQNNYTMHGLFPIPLYSVNREADLDSTEEKEIEDIIEEGPPRAHYIEAFLAHHPRLGNYVSDDSYIFNSKLKKIKQFCEQQLKIYVEQAINPEQELDFYITQSWLNTVKPGASHHIHTHQNSIISGVYYIATIPDDTITFRDPNELIKDKLSFEVKDYNRWNASKWTCPVKNNDLILFPSWLSHGVEPRIEKVTTDRISISFNTFTKGSLGSQELLTELIL